LLHAGLSKIPDKSFVRKRCEWPSELSRSCIEQDSPYVIRRLPLADRHPTADNLTLTLAEKLTHAG
jgi:hypothetical protein